MEVLRRQWEEAWGSHGEEFILELGSYNGSVATMLVMQVIAPAFGPQNLDGGGGGESPKHCNPSAGEAEAIVSLGRAGQAAQPNC